MMWQSDGTTPLWIPFEAFETKDECVSFVQLNQIGLFERAIQQYEGKIPPQQIFGQRKIKWVITTTKVIGQNQGL